FVRSVRAWLRAKARALGVRRPLTGAVAFTQRFSSRLLIYPHVHCLIPDGVFALAEAGEVLFHELKPRQTDIEAIVSRVARKAAKLLARLDPDAIEPDPLDRMRACAQQGELPLHLASVEQIALVSGRMLANVDGYSLQAARHLHQNDRKGLEFLVRYVLRPPLALERMTELPSGNILITFKRPLPSGSAAMELTPMALLRRLAALVPTPGSHGTSYYGVFASNAKLRKRLVRPGRKSPESCRGHPGCEAHDADLTMDPQPSDPLLGLDDRRVEESPEEHYIPWAALLKRVHGVEVLRCDCGGLRTVVRCVTEQEEIKEELEALGLWKQPPEVAPARRSLQAEIFDELSLADGVDPPAPDDAA
ncbi:MAG TPA: transposase, partial [Candidatus Dormibacteraeota bacterium]|nr:transposase [Candidatus Dormibacteraeota bacterium]